MIKFWYDLPTLEHRYIETVPNWNSSEMAVRRADGNIEIVPKHSALDVHKYSVVVGEPQELLDALIAAGFKPNKMEGTPGHVSALEKHIGFAERVVDKLLGAE